MLILNLFLDARGDTRGIEEVRAECSSAGWSFSTGVSHYEARHHCIWLLILGRHMLSFSTEFPVGTSSTNADFLASIAKWILGSPHTRFIKKDLAGLATESEFVEARDSETIESLQFSSTASDGAGIRYTRNDGSLEWATTVMFSRQSENSWVGVRVTCESKKPAVRLPAAKKPIIVRTLLQSLGGGIDGPLRVRAEPHALADRDIDIAATCINGRSCTRLPLIYVSAHFQGGHIVNATDLADKLGGMAHVMVEPNRAFSIRLMNSVDGQNVYGGTIGIYWPEGGGRRSFFLGGQYDSQADVEKAVTEEIRTALLNRRPLPRCTWNSLQESMSRIAYNALKASGSNKVEEYVATFDKELAAKQQELDDAEKEIARLEAEIRRYQAKSPMQGGLALSTGAEQDFFPSEILGVVMWSLQEASAKCTADSRRLHILSELLKANTTGDVAARKKDLLKETLRAFKSMDAKTRRVLEEFGFEITEDGKHYKAIYHGDDRYTFAMPKSGSDHRGGLNLASDIAKRIL